jgi:adenine phosphoribosyltransferase
MAPDCWPSLIFSNDVAGNELVGRFAESSLLPFLHEDLQQLTDMVRQIPDFPRPGIEFRHVLDICQQPGGLKLCTSLLQSHYAGEWAKVDLLVSCEAGGFVFGSALAARVNRPLSLVREAGKLPPPTVSVVKYPSHISSLASDSSKEQRFEMSRNVVSTGCCVVVVDDVLATGKTLCAVLSLLAEAGVHRENIGVLTVAEFPVHRGRDLLRRFGFSRVRVQSLLVFGSA